MIIEPFGTVSYVARAFDGTHGKLDVHVQTSIAQVSGSAAFEYLSSERAWHYRSFRPYGSSFMRSGEHRVPGLGTLADALSLGVLERATGSVLVVHPSVGLTDARRAHLARLGVLLDDPKPVGRGIERRLTYLRERLPGFELYRDDLALLGSLS